MNIKENNWVNSVAYPVAKSGFSQTYEHIRPNTSYRVIAVDEEKEAITLHVFCDSKYYEETFWAGNFLKQSLTSIL